VPESRRKAGNRPNNPVAKNGLPVDKAGIRWEPWAEHRTAMTFLIRAPRLTAVAAAAFAALGPLVLPTHAQAEVQISGETDAVTINASDASLEEIFAALNTNYGLEYNLPENIRRSVSGTYTGSLSLVLLRLLQGYNFAVETSASGTRVRIYDLSAGSGSGISVARSGASELPAASLPPSPAPRLPAAPILQPAPSRPGFPLARAFVSAHAHRRPAGR
jgi:hypothetical protein